MPTIKNVDGQNVERRKADWDKTSKGKYADWDNRLKTSTGTKRQKVKNVEWKKR
jgi:hypothetical protein